MYVFFRWILLSCRAFSQRASCRVCRGSRLQTFFCFSYRYRYQLVQCHDVNAPLFRICLTFLTSLTTLPQFSPHYTSSPKSPTSLITTSTLHPNHRHHPPNSHSHQHDRHPNSRADLPNRGTQGLAPPRTRLYQATQKSTAGTHPAMKCPGRN